MEMNVEADLLDSHKSVTRKMNYYFLGFRFAQMNMRHQTDWATRVLEALVGGEASSAIQHTHRHLEGIAEPTPTVVSLLGTFECQVLIRTN